MTGTQGTTSRAPAHHRESSVQAGAHDLTVIKLRAIRSFVLIADGLSFQEAGEALGLRPPHVTKLIHGLEAALGVRLLTRNPHYIELTEAGLAAVPPCRALLEAAHDLSLSVSGRA